MEGSLLYVSRRLATPADIRDIVETSRVRNARLQVTGALVASRNRFAQILEGPRAALDALMDSIRRDRRHTEVEVVMHADIERRRFPEWTLAYSGTSVFVDGLIEALAKRADTRGHAGDVQRLVQAIEGLSRARP
ncbi:MULTISPECIES: BLUF domain-containing protein [Methylobacterium]|uniref:BLUF domain-containing protein n=2 Tax=Methylobacterium TaxID=407 RepID=A0A089NTJ6_9HYPH|nr:MULTISPECIES: BLUF domain-containing protein [Methylobacterium]ACB24558.1 BLUF domain protein [Methylobacterium radiotolerans JCM 2831]AIQ90737.1 BLUF domain-containing protein [Methylobacterium oryzae CBMB20]GEN01656.1 blue-light sensor BLUF [Methylobacterium radiotolerans]